MEPTPAHVIHARRIALGVLVVVVGVALAWALARPQLSLPITLTRVTADAAAVVVLGLAVLPQLDIARYRAELTERSSSALAVAAWVWLTAELVRLITAAAATADVRVLDLGARTTVQYALATVAGRADLICLVAALIVGAAAVTVRGAAVSWVIAGVAALGTAARTLAGHLSDSALGGIAVTLHALAAALWCGALAALVLTVAHRGQWSRVLPRFSVLSLWCVVVLLVGGTVSAAVTVGSPAALLGTGYGRLLLAKVVVTIALIALAWQNRSHWLPSARAHRVTAQVSARRSDTELALMVVALTLAAALAVSG
ncbi:CopD family protein [Mycobacterium sp. NPDC003323]